MIKVIIENKIPFIKGVLDDYCQVSYLAPENITAEVVKDVDAMIIRTRTRCDATLLEHSRCKFIATATIGTDHIDLDYCAKKGISVFNAPGCNAPAVAQYVFASIAYWRAQRFDKRPLESLTIGIVGVGHVGSIVKQWARQLGMNVLCCDPLRAEVECANNFVSLDVIARESDIITFHTPLTKSGKYPTFHMCDASFLEKVVRCPLIIDSARGPIVDTSAIIDALGRNKINDVVIDCWENEPNISSELLKQAIVATPHIAGYSREGKIRATAMVIEALTKHFGLPDVNISENVPVGAAEQVSIEEIEKSYSPKEDTIALKDDKSLFEQLRNTYNYRQEVISLS